MDLTFRTPLVLTAPVQPFDLGHLLYMHADPQVMATLGGLKDEAWTRDYLRRNLEHWERYGYGLWILRGRAAGEFVGRGVLRHYLLSGGVSGVEDPAADVVEVGYALMPEYWGRGIATEVARELVRIAFEGIGLGELVAFTLPTNVASRRVMEKAGFTYTRDFVHAGLPHVLYRQAAPPPVESVPRGSTPEG